jgi:hypothetical protein
MRKDEAFDEEVSRFDVKFWRYLDDFGEATAVCQVCLRSNGGL